jgi:hypothetical protein
LIFLGSVSTSTHKTHTMTHSASDIHLTTTENIQLNQKREDNKKTQNDKISQVDDGKSWWFLWFFKNIIV